MPLPATPTIARLDARLVGPGTDSSLSASEVAALRSETGLDVDALLYALLPWAQRWARPPISGFDVGAIALGESGAAYLGANLEFEGLPTANTIHAEQSAITMAWAAGESGIEALATSAAPCGHCRQFMLELPSPGPRLTIGAGQTTTLDALLPSAFGPQSLGVAPTMLTAGPHPLAVASAAGDSSTDPLVTAALEAARRCNAPYSRAHTGAAVRTDAGQIAAGPVLESAAYNPSLGPVHAAIVVLHHRGGDASRIVDAVLVERDDAKLSHAATGQRLLDALGPTVSLRRVLAR